jgi:hypothetical protein
MQLQKVDKNRIGEEGYFMTKQKAYRDKNILSKRSK